MIDSDINAALRPIFGTEVHPQRRRQPDGTLVVPLLPAVIWERVSDDYLGAATMCGISDSHNIRLQVDVYARPYKTCLQLAEQAALALDALGYLRITKQNFPEDPDRASRVLLEYSIWETSDIEIPEVAVPLSLTSISPVNARGGDPALVLSLTGSFALGDVVEAVGFGTVPTGLVSATELQAVLPAACFTVGGAAFNVKVHRGGEESDTALFQVFDAPAPSGIDLVSVPEDAGSVSCNVYGTWFRDGDQMVIDGEPVATIFDTDTQMHTVGYPLTALAGDVLPVQVRYQAPDGAWTTTPRAGAPSFTVTPPP